jgi:hypothetical protein
VTPVGVWTWQCQIDNVTVLLVVHLHLGLVNVLKGLGIELVSGPRVHIIEHDRSQNRLALGLVCLICLESFRTRDIHNYDINMMLI